MASKPGTKHVEALTHDEAKRKIIPSVEQRSIAILDHIAPRQTHYRRNTDLGPKLVRCGKDEQDWNDWWSTRHRETCWEAHSKC